MRRCIRHFLRDASGTSTVEAALVMLPLMFFFMILPAISLIWASEQYARTETHRDMFDKTTTILPLPKGTQRSSHDYITEAERRRAFPGYPPLLAGLAGNPTGIINSPSPVSISGGYFTTDLFPEGFPNEYVEGWKYRKVKYAGGWWTGELELLRYGAVARTPWTWLGWPVIPTQDVYHEPRQIHAWYDDNVIDDRLKERLMLID